MKQFNNFIENIQSNYPLFIFYIKNQFNNFMPFLDFSMDVSAKGEGQMKFYPWRLGGMIVSDPQSLKKYHF